MSVFDWLLLAQLVPSAAAAFYLIWMLFDVRDFYPQAAMFGLMSTVPLTAHVYLSL